MSTAKQNMLSERDGEHFFELFSPLLAYADLDTPFILDDTMELRRRSNLIWRDVSLIDTYIAEMDRKRPEKPIPEEDREIMRSWKRFRSGVFYVVSNQPDGTLFVDKSRAVYRILGLQTPLEEIFPKTPIIVETTLLPWKDVLITDGIYSPVAIANPGKVKPTLDRMCRNAIERGTVVTSF